MPGISGSLDFALSIVCLGIAAWGSRRRNDFLVLGFVWIAAAALAGAFKFEGFTEATATHQFLTQVSSGIGMFMVGIGVLTAVFGSIPGASWLAPVVALFGAGLIHHLADWPHLEKLNLALGIVCLFSLVVLAVVGMLRGRLVAGLSAIISLGAILVVGFVLPNLQYAKDASLQRVDFVHLFLITCYFFLWIGVRNVGAGKARSIEG